jgi:hypothetical protein
VCVREKTIFYLAGGVGYVMKTEQLIIVMVAFLAYF